jgi:hypothetical protein
VAEDGDTAPKTKVGHQKAQTEDGQELIDTTPVIADDDDRRGFDGPLALTPVFVIEGLDISMYDSVDDAAAALEGVDVEAGLYSVFDIEGRRIVLKGEGVHETRFIVEVGTVRVESIEAEPSGAEELRQSLLQFGRRCEWPVNEDTTLNDLVELAREAM